MGHIKILPGHRDLKVAWDVHPRSCSDVLARRGELNRGGNSRRLFPHRDGSLEHSHSQSALCIHRDAGGGRFYDVIFFYCFMLRVAYLYCIFIWQDVTGNVLCDSGLAILKVVVLGVLELRVVTKTIAVRFFASGPTKQRRPSLVAFYDWPEMVWQFYRITWT